MQRLPNGGGGDAVTEVGRASDAASIPQPLRNKQALLDWQPIGDAAADIVDRLARQRQRCEFNAQLAEWIIDLSRRINDRGRAFMWCDASAESNDLELEVERLRLAIALARRCRR